MTASSNIYHRLRDFLQRSHTPQLWILSDDSHRQAQSIGLAQQLGDRCGMLSLYDIAQCGGVAAFFTARGQDPAMPKIDWARSIVLHTGAEGVGALHDIHRISDGRAFVVQLLDPGEGYEAMDLVVTPNHEPRPNVPEEKWVPTKGILHPLTQETLHIAARHIHEDPSEPPLAELPSPRCVVLLGGKHVGGDIDPSHAARWIEALATELQTAGGSLLVTTSPRTGAALATAIEAALQRTSIPSHYYQWNRDRHRPNPYLAWLALADVIAVSGDSVRMCSEALLPGAPVVIYKNPDITTCYDLMHQALCASGRAQMWQGTLPLSVPKREGLCEAACVAKIVRARWAQKRARPMA